VARLPHGDHESRSTIERPAARAAQVTALPSFRKPPVVEVAIAAQFGEIRGLTGPHLGLLWRRYRESFPKLDVHPPLDARYERAEPAPAGGLTVRLEQVPTPRAWFKGSNEVHLIQVQKDRFVFNWRRMPGRDYPRYERVIESFLANFESFQGFLADEELGRPVLNQWELTYVNHISAGDGWNHHGELGSVIPLVESSGTGGFLPQPEDIALRIRYRITDQPGIARLHVEASPGFDQHARPTLQLTLTARGGLEPDAASSLESSLNAGREWIVRGFADVTSRTMHEIWERER